MGFNLGRVAVVCKFPFPEGLAATTRIIAYMKGIIEHDGIRADVFVYTPTDVYNKKNNKYDDFGCYDGIFYHYPSKRMYSKYKLFRVLTTLNAPFKTCYHLWKENKIKKIDFLLISNDFLFQLYVFTLFARFIGVKPIFITDEFPEPIRKKLKSKISKLKIKLYEFILKYEEGLIFMTNKLNIFYNTKLCKPYHILPTIIDTSRFDIPIKENIDSKYLCYMGNMELAKDNITNIISAFSIIANKHEDVLLNLYGQPSDTDLKIINQTIENCGVSNRVFIKGRCRYEDVPSILKQAHILVSSQPNTMRAEGGFPTKLGEYLASGIPTILTDVGEISQYVRDSIHVYLVPPEDPIKYAEKLDYMLSHYDVAKSVAKKGKDFILSKYDYKVVSKELLFFLENLNKQDL